AISNNKVYAAYNRYLNVYDISDPSMPIHITKYKRPPCPIEVISPNDNLFTLSVGDSVVIKAFDCSIPDTIVFIDSLALFTALPGFNVGSLFYDSQYVYCSHAAFIAILS
ncbi:MAG: hypothetical protein ACTSQ8_12850, partial [Candidatus Helarchaeota archaeon]